MYLMKLTITCSVATLLLVIGTLAGDAQAAVLDQSNPIPDTVAESVGGGRTRTQTLTVGISGVLSQVAVGAFRGPDTFEDLTLIVRSTIDGAPFIALTTATLPASAFVTIPKLVVFDVSAANLSFSAGDVIAIELASLANNTSPFLERYNWSFSDPYAGGTRYPDRNPPDIDFMFQTFVEPAAIQGDLDGDGFVGINDLNIVLGNWNQNVPPADLLADPSGDGFVGVEDLNTVLGNWNAGIPPGDGSVVPEPLSLWMMGVSGLVVFRRKVHAC